MTGNRYLGLNSLKMFRAESQTGFKAHFPWKPTGSIETDSHSAGCVKVQNFTNISALAADILFYATEYRPLSCCGDRFDSRRAKGSRE